MNEQIQTYPYSKRKAFNTDRELIERILKIETSQQLYLYNIIKCYDVTYCGKSFKNNIEISLKTTIDTVVKLYGKTMTDNELVHKMYDEIELIMPYWTLQRTTEEYEYYKMSNGIDTFRLSVELSTIDVILEAIDKYYDTDKSIDIELIEGYLYDILTEYDDYKYNKPKSDLDVFIENCIDGYDSFEDYVECNLI